MADSMEVLLERVDGNVAHLKEDFAELKAQIPAMHKRIDELEKKQARYAAWVSGAVAAAGALSQRKEILALLFTMMMLIAGCAAPSLGPRLGRPGETFRWAPGFRPVVVLVSEGLSDECLRSLEGGLAYWYAHGVTYLEIFYNVPEPLTRVEEFLEPTIGVSEEAPVRDSHAGSTKQYAFEGLMLAAEVRFRPEFCVPGLASHELGHALGLADDYRNPGNVMFWAFPGLGPNVTAAQLEVVR